MWNTSKAFPGHKVVNNLCAIGAQRSLQAARSSLEAALEMASGAASAMATEPSSQASSGTAPEPSTLDLEAYSANYVGITRIKRLAFIASASP